MKYKKIMSDSITFLQLLNEISFYPFFYDINKRVKIISNKISNMILIQNEKKEIYEKNKNDYFSNVYDSKLIYEKNCIIAISFEILVSIPRIILAILFCISISGKSNVIPAITLFINFGFAFFTTCKSV